MLKHRPRLFDAIVSPTICYAARNMGTKQRNTKLIIHTRRIYKKIEKQDVEPKDENRKVDITDMCIADDESGDHDDADSEVTFEDDPDEEMG